MEKDSTLKILADLKDLKEIRRFVKDKAIACHVNPSAIYDLLLVTTEAVTNIIVHGYQGRQGEIEITAGREGDSFVIILKDKANPFDPTQVPLPDLTNPLGKRPLGGMGVFLMRDYLDQIIHQVTQNGGNQLTMIKSGIIQNPESEEPNEDKPKESTRK